MNATQKYWNALSPAEREAEGRRRAKKRAATIKKNRRLRRKDRAATLVKSTPTLTETRPHAVLVRPEIAAYAFGRTQQWLEDYADRTDTPRHALTREVGQFLSRAAGR